MNASVASQSEMYSIGLRNLNLELLASLCESNILQKTGELYFLLK